MFKKILTAAAMTTAMLSTSAIAGGPDMMPEAPACQHCFKPFIGVNYSYLNVSASDNALVFVDSVGAVNDAVFRLPSSFNGVGFEAGAKYGPYFGTAFGMTHYFESSTTRANTVGARTDTTTVNVSLNNFYIEARGYWQLMDAFDFIFGIGADVIQAVVSGTVTVTGAAAGSVNGTFNTGDLSGNHLAWRFGAGADYYFTPNWGVQAMFHYMPTGVTGIGDFWTIDAGLYYMFS